MIFIIDPFAGVTSSTPASHSLQSSSPARVFEPQLIVPPASPTDQSQNSIRSESSPLPSNTSMSMTPSGTQRTNPYSRSATSGHRSRPMFPSSNQFYQSSPAPTSAAPLSHAPPTADQPLVSGSPTTERPAANLSSPPNSQLYQQVIPHWFYCKYSENSGGWSAFSNEDSHKLERLYQEGELYFMS